MKQTLKRLNQLMGGLPVGYLQAWLRICARDYRKTNPSGQRGRLEPGTSGLQVQRPRNMKVPFTDPCSFGRRSKQALLSVELNSRYPIKIPVK